MLVIASTKPLKAVFSYKLGNHFNYGEIVTNVTEARWRSELFVTIYGQELDCLYETRFYANSGKKVIRRKMMINEILRILAHFERNNFTYLVA